MSRMSWLARRCAVCGMEGTEMQPRFAAVVSCDEIVLRHVGESQESEASGICFCSEEHASQFLVRWLYCERQSGGTEAGRVANLPRTDDFHLSTTDAAVELSLSMALQTFWEESARAFDSGRFETGDNL